jgi:hypothetical protein
MRIMMSCKTHKAVVVSAEARNLHFIPTGPDILVDGMKHYTEFELDEGNLYCTGGTGEHEFEYTIQCR